jgi:murein hydrolase activator
MQSLAQVDSNQVFLASKGTWKFPVSQGHMLDRVRKYNYSGITISSDSVFEVKAVFDGRILLINQYDDVFLIIIKYGSYYLAYSNLAKVIVKKGDTIKKGEMIGPAGKNLDNTYALDLQFSKNYMDIDPSDWFVTSVK